MFGDHAGSLQLGEAFCTTCCNAWDRMVSQGRFEGQFQCQPKWVEPSCLWVNTRKRPGFRTRDGSCSFSFQEKGRVASVSCFVSGSSIYIKKSYLKIVPYHPKLSWDTLDGAKFGVQSNTCLFVFSRDRHSSMKLTVWGWSLTLCYDELYRGCQIIGSRLGYKFRTNDLRISKLQSSCGLRILFYNLACQNWCFWQLFLNYIDVSLGFSRWNTRQFQEFPPYQHADILYTSLMNCWFKAAFSSVHIRAVYWWFRLSLGTDDSPFFSAKVDRGFPPCWTPSPSLQIRVTSFFVTVGSFAKPVSVAPLFFLCESMGYGYNYKGGMKSAMIHFTISHGNSSRLGYKVSVSRNR